MIYREMEANPHIEPDVSFHNRMNVDTVTRINQSDFTAPRIVSAIKMPNRLYGDGIVEKRDIERKVPLYQ